MLQVGSLVDNKYKILNEIGHGGMSVVYLAINEVANKTWAVKEVRKDGVCNFEAVKQGLVVETDMLKKLDHPYLPSIIDVIEKDDSFLIVMDYIQGKSLKSVLANSGAQNKENVVKWGIQLCDVLGYLHSRQPPIIYRDMKPANVMLRPDGNITLIDFGTAREFKNRNMVEDTTCLGTRGYAAPEQFGGRGQTDPRTDIYCLGATLYHLITGRSPAEPPYEIKPLSYWIPSYADSGLEAIINKCCQQDPESRYQSCAELRYDLEHVDELDAPVRRRRFRKWCAFLASVALFVTGSLGMVGFRLAEKKAMEETYEYYLDMAQAITGEQNFQTFSEYALRVIAIDPGRLEGYDLLLSRVEEDGKLDKQKEWSTIYQSLNSLSDGNSRSNESVLLNTDVQGYADLQYRIGKLLFLMSDGSNQSLREAASYFEKALNRGGMAAAEDEETRKKAALAKSLSTIGNSIEALTKGENTFLESDYTYASLWQDLKMLIETYSIDAMGSRAYGIALYSRVAYMIQEHCRDFELEGVSLADISGLLDQLQDSLEQTQESLTSSEINRHFGDLIDSAQNTVDTARKQIAAMGGVY